MANILFLSSRGAARGAMAGAIAQATATPDLNILVAGLEPAAPHPLAARVLAEIGLSVSNETVPGVDALGSTPLDVVVILSDSAARNCPAFPGHPIRVDWNLPAPGALEDKDDEAIEIFRQERDRIKRLWADFINRGYLEALLSAKRCEKLILDNISDGIIVHDMNRRICFFNKSAQQITGYAWEDVVSKDCHHVFPGNFCGSLCPFIDGDTPDPDLTSRHQEFSIVTKDGERRFLDVMSRPMMDPNNEQAGVIISFQDHTRERDLARRAGEITNYASIVGQDPKMLEVFDMIQDLAETDVPVLIQGDSGTGKELVAAAIHNEGPRAAKEFIAVNCGALPESLLESELFGHVRGAFTGAIRDKKGRFELADGGTILLDEIGDVSQNMQVKLLRVLQEGTFERVGSETTLRVNVRIISATNKDLAKELREGRFREDLYYRLSVVPLWIPPLRERRSDIPLLVSHILKQEAAAANREGMTLSPDSLEIMIDYDWPGNVRELQNWIRYAMVKCKNSVIRPDHLPKGAGVRRQASHPRRRKLDRDSIEAALNQTHGNKKEAAKILGVSRATLYRFLDTDS